MKKLLLLSVLFMLLIFHAAGQAPDKGAVAKTAFTPAYVMIGTHPVLILRAGITNLSPADRAVLINARLEKIIRKGQIDEIKTIRRSEGTLFMVGDELAFMIANEDVDAESGETMEKLTALTAATLKTALTEAVRMRSWPYLIRCFIEAVVGSIIAFLLVFFWYIMQKKLILQLGKIESRLLKKLSARGSSLLDNVLSFTRAVFRMFFWLALLVIIFFWLLFILHCIPQTRLLGITIAGYMSSTLKSFGTSIINSIPQLMLVCAIMIFTYFTSRGLKTLFRGVTERKISLWGMPPDLAGPTSQILNILLWILAVIVAYPYMPGSSSDAFKGISIFIGVIISLGSANIFSQLMAGITLMYSRPFKNGDVIKAGDVVGTVKSISYLSTRIWTIREEMVTIPNFTLLTASTQNYSMSVTEHGLLCHTIVSIGYDAPWRTIHQLLLNAAAHTDGISLEPPPWVLQPELADFYVVYELNFRIKQPEGKRQIMSQLHANIQDEFNLAGIQIMSPHFVSNAPEKVYVPREQWGIRPDEKPPFRG